VQLIIKYKLYFFLVLGLISIALLINSCKKDNSDTVAYFLTIGSWQLASVQTQYFVGDTLKTTDTLNTTCNLSQNFQFKSDNSCTLTNYHCLTQTTNGKWQLSSDNLTLLVTMSAQDTLKGAIVTVPVFQNSQIINLGSYSMVLQTGDTSPYYTSKSKRTITRYGFIHAINQ
jgi:hypothetical protein